MAKEFAMGPRLTIDGEAEFKTAIAGINKDMSVLGSEMKLVTSTFGDNKNSIEALTSKSEVYNKQIVEQKDKIKILTDALQNAKTEYGENSDKVKDWQIQLNNAEGQLAKTESALKQTTEQAKKLGQEKFDNFANGLKKVGEAAVAVGAAILVGFGAALVSGAKDAIEAETKVAQLDATLKSTGGAAGMTRDSLLSLAQGFEETTKFSAEAALEAESLLLTFTNIGSEVFPRATQAAADMATAMGTDMAGQSIALGKALNDPIAGISALSRVGVTFTDGQKEAITSMVAMGDVAGAQTIILQELEKEFGGSAEAAGKTFGGQLEILKNAFGGVTEELAMQFMPILTELLTWIIDNMPQIKEIAGKAFDVISTAISTTYKWFSTYILPILKDVFSWVQTNMPTIQLVVGTVFSAISEIVGSVWRIFQDNLLPILQDLWDFISPTFPLIKAAVKLAFDAVIIIVQTVIDIFDAVTSAIKNAIDWLTSWNRTPAEDKYSTVTTAHDDTYTSSYAGGNGAGRGDAYANGTPSATAGLHWVGEYGPELLNFRGGESVLNARDSAKAAGTIINFNGSYSFAGQKDIDYFMNKAAVLVQRRAG